MALRLPFRRRAEATPASAPAGDGPLLPSARFRHEREADWRRLEALLDRADRRGAAALDEEELLALPTLYRATISALSVARETSLDRALIDYLEALSARAYLFLYGVRGRIGPRLARFFRQDWPAAVRGLWKETIAAALLLAAGSIAGYGLVAADPGWFAAMVPGGLVQGRTPDASAEMLRQAIYQQGKAGDGLEIMAGFLFTHNAQMALLCFALGFLLAVPSSLLLIGNGLTLGAFLALYARKGLAGELTGWLCIHGTTELFAIILAGAAGIRIGWAMAFPGRLSRLDAMAEAGRQAGLVMAGVVLMLFAAALLEGFARQLVLNEAARYAIGGLMLAIWLGFFYRRLTGAPR
jgi:uncharacterized membrane protein SpoIIM required for sporulation